MNIHTQETAPKASLEALQSLTKTFGWAPNVIGVFAGSPVLIQSYRNLHQIFSKNSVFTAEEQEIIQVTNNIENNCEYCMAAHSTVIKSLNLLSDNDLEALRNQTPLSKPNYNALRAFTLAVFNQQGRVSEQEKLQFLSHGYTDEHILEIIAHIAFKVITNFTNNLVTPELDEPFKDQHWEKAKNE